MNGHYWSLLTCHCWLIHGIVLLVNCIFYQSIVFLVRGIYRFIHIINRLLLGNLSGILSGKIRNFPTFEQPASTVPRNDSRKGSELMVIQSALMAISLPIIPVCARPRLQRPSSASSFCLLEHANLEKNKSNNLRCLMHACDGSWLMAHGSWLMAHG